MNTTFDAKEAVKLMLDGFKVKGVTFNKEYWIENNIINYIAYGLEYIIGFQDFLKKQGDFCLADKKLVKWYRPKIFWCIDGDCPYIDDTMTFDFFKDKTDFFKEYGLSNKVLEWKTEYFPETWEQCE